MVFGDSGTFWPSAITGCVDLPGERHLARARDEGQVTAITPYEPLLVALRGTIPLLGLPVLFRHVIARTAARAGRITWVILREPVPTTVGTSQFQR